MRVEFSPDDLRPVIDAAVRSALDQQQAEAATLNPDRISYYEPEAAQLVGIPSHVLRDARLRGEIVGSRIGKRIVYERAELLRFIREKREER